MGQVVAQARCDAHEQERHQRDDADEVADHPLGEHLGALRRGDKTELNQPERPGRRRQCARCQCRDEEGHAVRRAREIESVSQPSAQWKNRHGVDAEGGEPAVDEPEHVDGEDLGRGRPPQSGELHHRPDHLHCGFQQETAPAEHEQGEEAEAGRQVPQADDAETVEQACGIPGGEPEREIDSRKAEEALVVGVVGLAERRWGRQAQRMIVCHVMHSGREFDRPHLFFVGYRAATPQFPPLVRAGQGNSYV